MPTNSMQLKTPEWFKLRTVALSHGWYDLPPFAWDEPTRSLGYVATLSGRPVQLTFYQPRVGLLDVAFAYQGRARTRFPEETGALAQRIFGLERDYASFYRLAGKDYAWAKRLGAGPLLRGASVFEDAIKMLATTNCSWSLTRQMIQRLVEHLGAKGPSGAKAFPTPEVMAGAPLSFYRDEVRAGYRSPFIKAFAEGVASRTIDCEAWADFHGPTATLIKTIRQSNGFGKYAAENLCKLLGRYDGLGLDSWCLKKFPLVHGNVRGDVASAIEKHYDKLGEWKGLALWLDLTKDWHHDQPENDKTTHFQKH